MSQLTPSKQIDSTNPHQLNLAIEPQGWLDQKLAWMSEFISPILVKETRQAFKSRQFFWTFFLLLTATAVWSVMGYSIGVAQYNHPGQFLLTGYWAILGIPLGIIIPFTVFRSLASEYEYNTIQLVSITTMKPHQIVIGKIGSAMLQMMVFFSVLAPCISFTYLLRGVDLSHVLFGLSISFFGSLGLSMVGLFLAGVTMNNVFRIGLSVVFMFGLFMAYMGFTNLMAAIGEGYGPDVEALPSLMFGTCASLFALGFLAFAAASAQVSFPADNRSTMIRIAMLVLNAVTISMFGLALMDFVNEYFLWFVHIVICHLWMIFGFMMCGENPFMSPRVRRSLPNSFITKSTLSFLLPGPGRGYLFALINLWGWTIVLSAFAWSGDQLFTIPVFNGALTLRSKWNLQLGLLANGMYATLFLSVTFLIIAFLRNRRTYINPGGGLIVGILITGFSLILSLTLHFAIVPPARTSVYSVWQLYNWYWSGIQWVEFGSSGANVTGTILLSAFTAILSLFCVVISSRELIRVRVAIPQRVLQDIEEHQPSYVEPTETIDNIFEQRKSERDL